MIKDAAKMQIDQTGKSGTISMTVEQYALTFIP